MKPGAPLFCLALMFLALGCAGFFSETAALLWLLTGLALLPLLAADALVLLCLSRPLTLKREMPQSLAQGERARVRLVLSAGGRGYLAKKVLLWDMHPLAMRSAAFPAALDGALLRRGGLVFEYEVIPEERGNWAFTHAEALLASPLRLWRRKVILAAASRGKTYPDFKKIQAAAGRELRVLLERTGLKPLRRRGQGLEFESLGNFKEGDSIRAIDWRATSRSVSQGNRRRVIVREYREEQDQQVLLLLDSGYRLHRLERSGAALRLQFDSALEAALLLAWVSLKHGDSVAALSFGAERRWVAPVKGASAFRALMNGLYDLHSAPVPSSPFRGLEDALARLRRRTFIILISAFNEEDGPSLSPLMRAAGRRHLLLAVSMLEHEMEALASSGPGGQGARKREAALEAAAAFACRARRRELFLRWEKAGLLTLEASQEALAGALLDRYLKVKLAGRL
ncbi:MAG: DUF58 domain-containing protein [Treponema sp.]|jgi:uncharacterized protein (DUF58 family)|nr:DUF58 domain-containing protein [Treponema sp.]